MDGKIEKNLHSLNEVIIGSAKSDTAKLLSHLKRQGKVRRIAPRVYTTNLTDTPENIVRRNLWPLIGAMWPGARLSHRTAFEYAPHDGQVFLGYKYTRKVHLPGVTIHFLATPESLDGDLPFMGALTASSYARAFLENLEPDKTQGGVEKCVARALLEERLEAEFSSGGEGALNRLRDEAREISLRTHHEREFAHLDRMIGALMSTRPASVLTSPVALARAAGEPFDSARVDLFSRLLEHLVGMEFPSRQERAASEGEFRTFAFFESYFSNYIEGTEFELEEVRRIVESGVAMPTRYADSHDILGTYAIVSDRRAMSRLAKTPEEFMDLLRERHRMIMAGRPDASPGEFKTRDNRAGQTHFVAFDRVRGTLRKGFEMSRAIRHPFAKAVFVMFVTSEVHPFSDGNGRMSRIMMNSELVAANETRILVPTVFRPDYIGALRRLSRSGDPEALIAAMSRLHAFSSTLSGEDVNAVREKLEAANAFKDEDSFTLRF